MCNFQTVLVIAGWGISCEIALIWMSLDLTDDQSTSVQVMAWCRQATSHYLSLCWPRSLSPYSVTRPQWVNIPGLFNRPSRYHKLPWYVNISSYWFLYSKNQHWYDMCSSVSTFWKRTNWWMSWLMLTMCLFLLCFISKLFLCKWPLSWPVQKSVIIW